MSRITSDPQHAVYILIYIFFPRSRCSAARASVSYPLLHVLVFIFFSMNTQLHTEGDRWRVTRTIDTRPLQQDINRSSCKIHIYERTACFNHCFVLFFFLDYIYVNIFRLFNNVLILYPVYLYLQFICSICYIPLACVVVLTVHFYTYILHFLNAYLLFTLQES